MWILAAALLLTNQQDRPGQGVVEINSTALVFGNGQPQSLAFEYDEAAVKALIPRRTEGASLYLHCRGFSESRHLTECRLDLDPEGQGYEAAADAFIRSVRIREGTVDLSRRDEILTVWIQLSLWNEDRRPPIPCRPPGCSVTPAPPPRPIPPR